jgi:membrane associated rhomboid family serine protease
MRTISRAVLGLLLVNIAAFAAGMLLPDGSERIVAAGALWFPANDHFRFWQVVTHMFLHANFSHIFFNMYALVSFGSILEREWGAGRFLVFYFLCGIGAGLVQLGVNWYEYAGLHSHLIAAGLTPDAIRTMLLTDPAQVPANPALQKMAVDLYTIYIAPMLGASGAIYGLLVAFGFLHPNAKLSLMFIPVPVAAKFFIPGLLLLDLFSGVTGFSLFGAGVAHFAHVGGGVIGFLLMLLWRHRRSAAAPSTIV